MFMDPARMMTTERVNGIGVPASRDVMFNSRRMNG